MFGRAPECVPPVRGRLVIRPPAQEADIDSAMSSAFEHVQGSAATVRHVEGRPHEALTIWSFAPMACASSMASQMRRKAGSPSIHGTT